jgi:hypothetical protein
MIRRQLCLQGLIWLVAALAACALHQPHPSGSLQDQLDALAPGATLALPAGRLVLTQPLVLRQRVTLTTQNASGPCREDGANCATLALRPLPGGRARPPVTLAAAGIVLDHLVIEGAKADPARDDTAACQRRGKAALGGLFVTADTVTIRDSVIRDVVCYSAVVVEAGADGFRFERNAVLSNGSHDRREMWADGLTIIDGTNDVIRDNLFRDNTDVQLVLGGCLRCTVADNRLAETDAPDAGAFAALLVHGWPHTSGDYAGTQIIRNTIDCGPSHKCGFGLGVGGRAWYVSPTSGGLIADNHVSRAAIGINVDDATGPITLRNNRVTESGGVVHSHCGDWLTGAVNITPASRRFVDPTAGVGMGAEDVTDRSFAGCIPGT